MPGKDDIQFRLQAGMDTAELLKAAKSAGAALDNMSGSVEDVNFSLSGMESYAKEADKGLKKGLGGLKTIGDGAADAAKDLKKFDQASEGALETLSKEASEAADAADKAFDEVETASEQAVRGLKRDAQRLGSSFGKLGGAVKKSGSGFLTLFSILGSGKIIFDTINGLVTSLGEAMLDGAKNANLLQTATRNFTAFVKGDQAQVALFTQFVRDLAIASGESQAQIANLITRFTALGASANLAGKAAIATLQLYRQGGEKGDLQTYADAVADSLKLSAEGLTKIGVSVGHIKLESLAYGAAIEHINELYGDTLNPLEHGAGLITEIVADWKLIISETVSWLLNLPVVVDFLKDASNFVKNLREDGDGFRDTIKTWADSAFAFLDRFTKDVKEKYVDADIGMRLFLKEVEVLATDTIGIISTYTSQSLGAAIGGAIGSVIPVLGTAIGASLGSAAALFVVGGISAKRSLEVREELAELEKERDERLKAQGEKTETTADKRRVGTPEGFSTDGKTLLAIQDLVRPREEAAQAIIDTIDDLVRQINSNQQISAVQQQGERDEFLRALDADREAAKDLVRGIGPDPSRELDLDVQRDFFIDYWGRYSEHNLPLVRAFTESAKAVRANIEQQNERQRQADELIKEERLRLKETLLEQKKAGTLHETTIARQETQSQQTIAAIQEAADRDIAELAEVGRQLENTRQDRYSAVIAENTSIANDWLAQIDAAEQEQIENEAKQEAYRAEIDAKRQAAEELNSRALLAVADSIVASPAAFVDISPLEDDLLNQTAELKRIQAVIAGGIDRESEEGKAILASLEEQKTKLTEANNTLKEANQINRAASEKQVEDFVVGNAALGAELAGAAGPQAAAVATAVQLANTLSKASTEQIQTMLEGLVDGAVRFVDRLIAAIPRLIEALVKALPKIIDSITRYIAPIIDTVIGNVPRIIQAVIDSVPDIGRALIDYIRSGGVLRSVAQGVGSALGITDLPKASGASAAIQAAEAIANKIEAEDTPATPTLPTTPQTPTEDPQKVALQTQTDLLKQILDAELMQVQKAEEANEIAKQQQGEIDLSTQAFNPYADPTRPQNPFQVPLQIQLNIGSQRLAAALVDIGESGYQELSL